MFKLLDNLRELFKQTATITDAWGREVLKVGVLLGNLYKVLRFECEPPPQFRIEIEAEKQQSMSAILEMQSTCLMIHDIDGNSGIAKIEFFQLLLSLIVSEAKERKAKVICGGMPMGKEYDRILVKALKEYAFTVIPIDNYLYFHVDSSLFNRRNYHNRDNFHS